MSIFHDMLKDRPFVMFVVSLILAFASLVFGEFWLLILAILIGAWAHYSEEIKKDGKDSS